jgi:hypothetical protein
MGNHRNLQAWLLDWMGKVQGKELALGLMLWAQMWYTRNEARGNTSIENPVTTARRIVYLVEEYEEYCTSSIGYSGRSLVPTPQWVATS